MRLLTAIAMLCLTAPCLHAAEGVYPVGSGITATYAPGGTNLLLGDTLTITRTLTNTTALPLTGLYLSDNLPPDFQIVSSSATVDNAPASYAYSASPDGAIVAGCASHVWTVSSPGVTGLPAGQSLRLELKLVPSHAGEYTLPLHAACFVADGNPYFSTGDAVLISVSQPPDTTPPSAIGDLEAQ